MIEEWLLGFDVRERWLDPERLWPTARRATYLLAMDVPKPLSTDRMVWPSVFEPGFGASLPESAQLGPGYAGVPTPPWIGPNADLWSSLPEMRRHLAANWPSPLPHATIAVTWLSDDGFADAGAVGPYREPTVPAARDPGWRLLGYDVSDGSRLSGLSNCGYSPSEARRLRAAWGGRLNSHHLFSDPADAFAFRALSDARVGEHAPFFVYGLYLIEEAG